MKYLDRYLLSQISAPLGLAFLVVTFLGVVGAILERLRDLPTDLVQIPDFIRISLYALPSLISYILPFTYLMALLIAFGQLAQHHEIVAFKAAGIPMRRLTYPALAGGALVTLVCFLAQDILQPVAVRRLEQMLYSEMPLRLSLDALPTGVMNQFVDWRVYVSRRDPQTGALHGIVVLKPEEDGGASAYYADSAQVIKENGDAKLRMTRGHFIPSRGADESLHLSFDQLELTLPKPPTKKSQMARQAMTLRELWERQKQLQEEAERTQALPVISSLIKDRQEISERFSLPLMSLALSLAAAPLGARAPRAGRSYAFVIGLVIAGGYYVLRSVSQPMGWYDLSWCILQAQIPNFVFLAVGLVLLWKVDRV